MTPLTILGIIGSILQTVLPLLAEAPHAGAESHLRPLLTRYCQVTFSLPVKQRGMARTIWDIKIAELSPSARAVVVDRIGPLQFALTRHDCERDVADILVEMDR